MNLPDSLDIIEDSDLRHLNTFRVGARARFLAVVEDTTQLRDALHWARTQSLPFMLIGQGSNILFRENYPGLVIEMHNRGIELVQETSSQVQVRVMAGEIWHDFVRSALARGWYGLENLSLIPGTVGAAPVQNIGAYGVEICETLVALEAMAIDTGTIRTFSNAECGFEYRSSVFKTTLQGRYVITSVTFGLSRIPRLRLDYPALKQALAGHDPATITPELVSDMVCRIRRSKLPDPQVLGNAGSFFRNPKVPRGLYTSLQAQWPAMPGFPDGDDVKIPAAWLIEQAGWKGHRDGDVGVHEDHALVLVNHGDASGGELVHLSERIQASVNERFGIDLQPEVRII